MSLKRNRQLLRSSDLFVSLPLTHHNFHVIVCYLDKNAAKFAGDIYLPGDKQEQWLRAQCCILLSK